MTYTFEPIGTVRSPFTERVDAPRQPSAPDAQGVEGSIELFAGKGFEHALSDLDQFDHLWVIFVFHRNVEQGRGWTPKVLPPRSERKHGLFATRSPHRPNPIGISAVRLLGVEGLTIRVADLDILDGTPVLDLKPYVPYADAIPEASAGWLGKDPEPPWEVRFSDAAREQLAWLEARGEDLAPRIVRTLALGPHPNPYRRIRREAHGLRLAAKEWRIDFEAGERILTVLRIRSGYRPQEIAAHPLHRDFAAAF